MLGSFTTEKKGLTAKSLTVKVIFSDISLMYTKKIGSIKWIPMVHQLYLLYNQFDDCPLSITLWNLLLRNLLISVSPEWASPEIPTCLGLYINPSCQTLSRASNMSRKNFKTSNFKTRISIESCIFHKW